MSDVPRVGGGGQALRRRANGSIPLPEPTRTDISTIRWPQIWQVLTVSLSHVAE